MKRQKWCWTLVAGLLALAGFARNDDERSELVDLFREPPAHAHTGVWWHWMGDNVSTNGIRKDLAYFKKSGITSATIFAMCDICTPWATPIPNGPGEGLVVFSPAWWQFVRFACEEGQRLGIDIGIHNCPGYTSTGGPWIPPQFAMRELYFARTNITSQPENCSWDETLAQLKACGDRTLSEAFPRLVPRQHAARQPEAQRLCDMELLHERFAARPVGTGRRRPPHLVGANKISGDS